MAQKIKMLSVHKWRVLSKSFNFFFSFFHSVDFSLWNLFFFSDEFFFSQWNIKLHKKVTNAKQNHALFCRQTIELWPHQISQMLILKTSSFNSISVQGGSKVKNSFLIYYSEPMFSIIFDNVSKCRNIVRDLCLTNIIIWMVIAFFLKCKKLTLFNCVIICAKLLILTVRFLFNSRKAWGFW